MEEFFFIKKIMQCEVIEEEELQKKVPEVKWYAATNIVPQIYIKNSEDLKIIKSIVQK